MVKVPTKNSLSDAGMHGVKKGGISGLGQVLGTSILGPGLGTAAGGIVAASSMSGQARDRAAERAVEEGLTLMMIGGGGGGGGSGATRGNM